MTSTELVDEFGKLGAHDMNKTYKGKTFELTGKVLSKGQFHDTKDLYIIVHKDPTRKAEILATFPDKRMQEVNKAYIGNLIKVRGKYEEAGFSDHGIAIFLQDCTVIN